MGRISSTHRDDEKCTQNSGWETSEGRALERGNINLGEIGCECGDWIELAQDRAK